MKVAGIFPIGTSDGGCPIAIAEILREEMSLEVHVVYGKQAAPDAPNPKDIAERIKASIRDPRVSWETCQQVEPFDLSEAYSQIRALVARISERNYDRVYVGITGATNPIVTSLFQSAMAYLPCQVLPIYVQARGAASVQHFLASDVRDRMNAEEALSSARSGQVRIAARLTDRLPPNGSWKFLRASLNALAHWDDFDYGQAQQTLEHQARKANYTQDHLLAPVANTVSRLAADAAQMSAFAKGICDQRNFSTLAATTDWADRVSKIGRLLVADVLANAQRRIVEGRFTDSVLRSYRAAECATQMRLLAIGIHPSLENLAFKAGLESLQRAGRIELAPIEDAVMKLGSTRNHSYLEHGYGRIQREQAQRCFDLSLSICSYLLGEKIGQLWRNFEMRF